MRYEGVRWVSALMTVTLLWGSAIASVEETPAPVKIKETEIPGRLARASSLIPPSPSDQPQAIDSEEERFDYLVVSKSQSVKMLGKNCLEIQGVQEGDWSFFPVSYQNGWTKSPEAITVRTGVPTRSLPPGGFGFLKQGPGRVTVLEKLGSPQRLRVNGTYSHEPGTDCVHEKWALLDRTDVYHFKNVLSGDLSIRYSPDGQMQSVISSIYDKEYNHVEP